MEITHQINTPDGPVSGGRILKPGEIVDTWCKCCSGKTPHRYQPSAWPPLVVSGLTPGMLMPIFMRIWLMNTTEVRDL